VQPPITKPKWKRKKDLFDAIWGYDEAIPLAEIPKEHWMENITEQDASGMGILHCTAVMGCWEAVPLELLTTGNMCVKDVRGETVYHLLVQSTSGLKTFFAVAPKELLNEQCFLEPNYERITPMHQAARAGNIGLLPASMLTEENLRLGNNEGTTVLHYMFAGDNPTNLFTETNIQILNRYGVTPLHEAARLGGLSKIKHLLTNKALSVKTADGHTCLHIAILDCHLDQIPEEFLTIHNALEPDINLNTPVHFAARTGQLDQLPSNIVEASLHVKNRSGSTPMHEVAMHGTFDCLPRHLLTEANLLHSIYNEATPLQMAVDYRNVDQLLGLELSARCKGTVGESWYKKNLAAIRDRQHLAQSDSTTELDLF